jgi:3-mercaptopyruvate sulfurtransferase SseA
MQEMGLENVCHLGGGINAWKQMGGPVEGVKHPE